MVQAKPTVPESGTLDLDLRDVRAFCRAVDLGSITAAALSSGESKGSVSRRVARLERALGAALLRRTGRRVEPTEEGLLYRQRAGAALDQLDEAAQAMRDQRGAPSGHLRVTAPIGVGTRLLGPILGPFVERYPEVTIEVVLTDAVLSFGEHRLDVALRLSDGLPDSSLVATRLFDLEGELAASPAYLTSQGVPTTPEDLARHRMLTIPRRGTSMPLALERDGVTTRILARGHVSSPDMLLLREAAIGGAGITVLPQALVERDFADGRLVRVLPEWRLAIGTRLYLMHAGGVIPPKVRAFREFMIEAVRAGHPTCPGA